MHMILRAAIAVELKIKNFSIKLYVIESRYAVQIATLSMPYKNGLRFWHPRIFTSATLSQLSSRTASREGSHPPQFEVDEIPRERLLGMTRFWFWERLAVAPGQPQTPLLGRGSE
jgi:hypothetical protein